jgi:hypothetical protein
MEYLHICHDECYLKGVVQETLYDKKLEDCTAMNYRDGKFECFLDYHINHIIFNQICAQFVVAIGCNTSILHMNILQIVLKSNQILV